MMELAALFIASIKHVIRVDDLIGLDYDRKAIDVEPEIVSHKIIGLYGSIGDACHEVMALDLITMEPIIIKI